MFICLGKHFYCICEFCVINRQLKYEHLGNDVQEMCVLIAVILLQTFAAIIYYTAVI